MIALLGSLALLFAGCTALVVLAGDATDGAVADLRAELESLASTTVAPTNTAEVDPGPNSPSDASTATPSTTAATETRSVVGTREQPLAFDAAAPLIFDAFGDADGSMWNTTIGPMSDIEAAVMAESTFNDPAPAGVTYAGFEVSMSLVEANKEPLSPGFNFSWEILGGATAAVYDSSTVETESFGCGVVPNGFDDFAEIFVGGTLSGTVCIPIPDEDLEHPDTRISLNFVGGPRIVFGADGVVVETLPTPQPAADFGIPDDVERDGSRQRPHSHGAETPVRFETFGDADGSVWATSIGTIADIGSRVLSESQFNEPPPEGITFAGFPATMTLSTADKEPLSPGFNFTWEIVGGATATVYNSTTVDTDLFGCGVVPDEFDDFAEVFTGGTLSGTVCIPIPTADLTHPNTRVSLNFAGGPRVYFGP